MALGLGCARSPGPAEPQAEPAPPELQWDGGMAPPSWEPVFDPGEPELPVAKAVLAGANRVDTYWRVVKGREGQRVDRRIVPLTESLSGTRGSRWRAVDSAGNWMDFLLVPEEGIYALGVYNERRGGSIHFREPMLTVPPTLRPGESFESIGHYTASADGYTTGTGNALWTITYLGNEALPLERMDPVRLESLLPLLEQTKTSREHARLLSVIRLKLPFGFYLNIEQDQWFHPVLGETFGEIRGEFGLLGVPIKGYDAEQTLIASRPLAPAEAPGDFDRQ